jgi:hypothetical protein
MHCRELESVNVDRRHGADAYAALPPAEWRAGVLAAKLPEGKIVLRTSCWACIARAKDAKMKIRPFLKSLFPSPYRRVARYRWVARQAGLGWWYRNDLNRLAILFGTWREICGRGYADRVLADLGRADQSRGVAHRRLRAKLL